MTRAHDEWGTDGPVLLGAAGAGGLPVAARPVAQHLGVVAGQRRAIPKGWPLKTTEPLWEWLGRARAPLTVLVAGVTGGVGTSTVAAVAAETVAAGSPGPTVVLDQVLTPWGDVSRRLLGQRSGLGAPAALTRLRQREQPSGIVRSAPLSAAGVAVLLDAMEPSPLRDARILVTTQCGALFVDAGRVDPLLVQRLDVDVVRPVVVLVGRADMAGAETTLAALAWLRRMAPVQPVVVLSATAPVRSSTASGAVRLVRTVATNVTYLPFDERLAHGQEIRLDKVGKTTAVAVPQVITGIRNIQEGQDRGSPSR